MPQALSVIQEVLKSDLTKSEKIGTIVDFDKVLGLNIINQILYTKPLPQEIKELIQQRKEVRGEKNFKESDRLRAEIEEQGYIVEDTKGRAESSEKVAFLLFPRKRGFRLNY